jgi:NAD(P)-dependent dehydrogenase (short-subunit alcohol dehydrogenase family)
MAGFNRRSTALEVSEGVDLRGRRAIVTGANTGIGLETARALALRGADVVMACRNRKRGEAAKSRLLLENKKAITFEQLDVRILDLGSLASVRAFAKDLLASDQPIHLLVNNAGVMLPDRRETADGHEAHFGTNHLGHFLLTELLIECILASAPARIVNVSSDACHFSSLGHELADLDWEERRFSAWRAYGDSKLMNILVANELHHRHAADGVVANALHPGIVRTELGRDQGLLMKAAGLLLLPVTKSPEQGAATTVLLSTADAFATQGGGYFADCAPGRQHRLADDRALQQALWKKSAELVGG